MRKTAWLSVCFLLIPTFVLAADFASARSVGATHTVYWTEDWEAGMGLWSASGGVWEVGMPIYGTSECIGSQCAATNLDGQYVYGTNSRLESVAFTLPATLADDVLWLGFWHWFSNSASNGVDYCSVQIWTEATGWIEVSHHYTRNSIVWTPFYIDITEFAGQVIKVGLYFNDEQDGSTTYQGPGWCVDDLRIFDGAFPELIQINRFDKTTDLDWDGWYPDYGVWERGEPVSGISAAHSRRFCFGTNLEGDYPYGTYSRLISPHTTLPAAPLDGLLYFSFKQYCSLSRTTGTDQGILQIDDGSGWVNLHTVNWLSNFGSQWTERTFEISAYAGRRVRFGFIIDDNQDGLSNYQSSGWYIDDLQFSEGARYVGNPEKFENFTPNWYAEYGVWEVGEPTSGPDAAYSPPNCWGTNLDGNYPYGTRDLLTTPPITLDNVAGLYLRFRHWYSFHGSNGVDYGLVQIRPDGGDWIDISSPLNGSSGGWTQFTYDLAAYAGQTVQFGFYARDIQDGSTTYQSSGWYIDDFEIVGMAEGDPPADPYALYVGITSGPAELTFYHTTENIDKVIIYGSTVNDFVPTLATRLAVLPFDATTFSDVDRPGWPATYYRVSVVDNLGNESQPIVANSISAVDDQGSTPEAGRLAVTGTSPNPFNPSTFINFRLPWADQVVVEIYDLRGRKVADLLHKRLDAGPHKVPFEPRGLASGVYFAKVSACGQTQCKKMVLLK